MPVLLVREVGLHLRVMHEPGEDVVEGQPLVLGAEQVLHPVALHI